jgi:hypothetical protein
MIRSGCVAARTRQVRDEAGPDQVNDTREHANTIGMVRHKRPASHRPAARIGKSLAAPFQFDRCWGSEIMPLRHVGYPRA